MSLGRILLAVAVAACLLGVGVLEVLSERAPRQQLLPTFPKVGDLRSDDTERWWESGEAVSGQALEAALAGPEGALTRDGETVTGDQTDTSLATLGPGDLVSVEPAGGPSEPVMVLRVGR